MEFRNTFPKSKVVGAATPGRLILFQYNAKTAEKLRFYDRNPLCYIVASQGPVFYGVNLHYYAPDEREMIMEWVDESNPAELPKGYHKYIKSYVQSPYLDIAMEEWQKAFNLPIEEFVRDLGSIEIPVSKARIQ